MLLKSVEVLQGEQPGRVRLVGRVRYDSDGFEEAIWFDLPEALRPQITSSGNPWLVLLLPLAVSLGEPLRLEIPVDPVLLERCHALLDVWHAWYPGPGYPRWPGPAAHHLCSVEREADRAALPVVGQVLRREPGEGSVVRVESSELAGINLCHPAKEPSGF